METQALLTFPLDMRSGGAASVYIPTGTALVKWGEVSQAASTYTGGIIITSDLNQAPYIDVFTIDSDSSPWDSSAIKPRTRIGNLDGVLGLSEQWGLATGKSLADTSCPYVVISDQQVGLFGVKMGKARGLSRYMLAQGACIMQKPHSKSELMTQISQIQNALAETVNTMSSAKFHAGRLDAWSPADYLKHLILSVKSVAKGITMPQEQLQTLFGQSERLSRTYAELVTIYKTRLAEGLRAEDYETFVPVNYRLPENVEDVKAYLVETWQESNTRLLKALENWEETDLDQYQLPHPKAWPASTSLSFSSLSSTG